MNAYILKRRYSLGVLIVLFLCFAIQLGGCAFRVKLVGEYDEITDRGLTELQQETSAFFAKIQSSSNSEASYEANKDFYYEVKGELSGLLQRAEIIESKLKRNPLTRNLNDLQLQFDDLALLHKTSPPAQALRSAEEAFNRSFAAIIEQMMYLKWNMEPPKSGGQ
jgi:hypothetical protein